MKRIIDADELKEAIETWDKFACLPNGELMPFHMLNEPEKDYEPYVHLRDIRYAIDNAPTVFNCRSCKNNGNERECVDCHDYSNYVHYENRPQGEWNYIQAGMCVCPFCGAYPHKLYKNFCPNCGANMGKR